MIHTIGASFDHFTFAVPDLRAGKSALRNLGFAFGNVDATDDVHVVFDNSYFELRPGGEGLALGEQTIEAKPQAALASLWLSFSDVDSAQAAFKRDGYEVTRLRQSGRPAKHGQQKGFATFRAFMLPGTPPFGNSIFFGGVQHLTADLIYSPQRFTHVNDIARIESLVFLAANSTVLDKSKEELEAVDYLARPFSRSDYIQSVSLIDSDEYRILFGDEALTATNFSLAAVSFSGGDKSYLKTRADETGVSSFYRDDNLYLDLRKDIGAFFIVA